MKQSIEFKDKIKSLEKIPEGYRVLFQTHSAVYYLKQSNPNFKSLEVTLKEFAINEKPLTVQTLSADMEIQVLTP